MGSKTKQLIVFTTADGQISVNTHFDEETAWLSLDQMAELFGRDKSTVSRHIKNVFDEAELEPSATVAKFATVQTEGERKVERQIEFYNLDVIISVGYRVKSLRGTQFRQWASKRLNEYIRKGYTLDDERLKNGGGRYFRELLQRIRDIRTSERNLYQQVTDIYAMTMAQWIAELDRQLQGNRRELLAHKGGISKQQAIEKAEKEFETYRAREMRQLQSDFDQTLKQLNTKAGKKI